MSLGIGPQKTAYATSKTDSSKVLNFSKVILEALNKKGHKVQRSNLSKIEYWYNKSYKLNDSKFDLLKNEVENTVKLTTDAVLKFIHETWELDQYGSIDSAKDIIPDIILTHITELNPINHSAIRDSWVSFIENLKDNSLFQSKPFRLPQELTIINYFQSNLTFNGQLKKRHLNCYVYMVCDSADLRDQFKSGSNSSVSSSISSHGSPHLYRGRTHSATLAQQTGDLVQLPVDVIHNTIHEDGDEESLLNNKQLVESESFSPSDTESCHNATHDESFGLQSPDSPVTHHEGPHTTNGKSVAYTDPNSPLGGIESGFNAQSSGSDTALNSIVVQQTGVLGQFPADVSHNTTHEDGDEESLLNSKQLVQGEGSSQSNSETIDSADPGEGDEAPLLNGMQSDKGGVLGPFNTGSGVLENRVFNVSSNNCFDFIDNGAGKRRFSGDVYEQCENGSQDSDESLDSQNGKNRINYTHQMLLYKCICLSSSILLLVGLYYFMSLRSKS